jgi:hypothetical protein
MNWIHVAVCGLFVPWAAMAGAISGTVTGPDGTTPLPGY